MLLGNCRLLHNLPRVLLSLTFSLILQINSWWNRPFQPYFRLSISLSLSLTVTAPGARSKREMLINSPLPIFLEISSNAVQLCVRRIASFYPNLPFENRFMLNSNVQAKCNWGVSEESNSFKCNCIWTILRRSIKASLFRLRMKNGKKLLVGPIELYFFLYQILQSKKTF